MLPPSLLALFLVLPFFAVSSLYAVTLHETVATNFLRAIGSDKEILQLTPLHSKAPDTIPPVIIGYRAELSHGGYLLLPGQTVDAPIKAYSLSHNFADLPPAYQRFLLWELEARFRARTGAGNGRQPLTTLPSHPGWAYLAGYDQKSHPQAYTESAILIASHWGQTFPFNSRLPQIDGQYVLAGCVNVAMGQLMRYYQYPASGTGVRYHDWNGRQLQAILFHSYDWTQMPHTITADTPPAGTDMVAALLRDLAVANQTDLALDNSGTTVRPEVLVENFGFSRNWSTMDNSDLDALLTVIKSEIDAGHPMLLSIPGHMGVADGYQYDQVGNSVHINLGWTGDDDDFYAFDQNIETRNYIFPPYDSDGHPAFTIYYGLTPCSGNDCAADREPGDVINGLTATGTFNDQADVDRFPIYLKGDVTIQGSRGYANQAFFFSLYDQNGTLLGSNPDPNATTSPPLQVTDLPAGRYLLATSLQAENGTFFDFNNGNMTDYTLTITGTPLSTAEQQAVAAAADQPPVFASDPPPTMVLGTNPGTARELFIDVRDADNDPVSLTLTNTNPTAATANLAGSVLTITPQTAGQSTLLIMQATAGGRSTSRDIAVLVNDLPVALGSEFSLQGIFAGQDSLEQHQVLLDGQCTIRGRNGYSNQAFYSMVKSTTGTTLAGPLDDELTATYPAGAYTIAVTMQDPNSPACYDFTPGVNDSYWLTVSCPQAAFTAEQIASLLAIDTSGMATILAGDSNGDGFRNLADLVPLLQILVEGEVKATDYLANGGDMDQDGVLGLADAQLLLRLLAADAP